MDPFFDQFFRDFFDPGYERRERHSSLGSGVIIDGKRGFILTNAHVIAKTGKITVILQDEREYEAQIVGADPNSDLAILQIEADNNLPAVAMGDSRDLMIGETVIAIGNPFGFSHTVTTGVISALDRSIRTEERVFNNFIQTDASINPGNSGGPLLNINGELIGINTAIYAKAQGIGFAIPIDMAKKIVADLIQYGEVVPAWIGITIQPLDPQLSQYLKLPTKPNGQAQGLVVKSVAPQSPADIAGIQNGDVILAIGSNSLYDLSDFQESMRQYAAGDPLRVSLWRKGQTRTVKLVASLFPESRAPELVAELLGIEIDNLTRGNRRKFQTGETQGVIITQLQRDSYLARIGAEPGDIVRRIDDVTIKDREQFYKTMVKFRQKNSLVVLLQRQNQLYHVTVELR
jgi:Do/DeqQ family serine protease